MADISVEFSVVDRFSQAMDKFTSMVEKCANGVDDLSEKADANNKNIEKISESTTVASTGFKGFGASMMVLNQAMQAFQRIAEPVKQALDDIATKQRVIVMFGGEAGRAFNRFAQDAAMSLGRVEGEIRKAGLKWQRVGIGGKNIMELTKLADRFANLNPDRSFEDIAETFKDAVKSKDVGGLADLLGGGEGVEMKLRRSGVERMLKRGDISGALEQFKKVADGFGYTQDKADEMGMTIDKKLQKIATLGRNYITDMFSDIVKRAEPYVDKLLKWLQSDDVQEALAKIRVVVSRIADAFFAVIETAIDAGKAVYNFVQDNKDFVMIAGGVILAAVGFVKIKAAVYGVITAIKAMNLAFLASPIFWIPAAILGITFVIQKVFNWITGESVSFIEMLVGIFVGGVTQIALGIFEIYQRLWNGIVSLAEGFINVLLGGIEDFINAVIRDTETARNTILRIVKGIVDDILKAIDAVASTGLGEKLGLNDALETLKQVSNAIDATSKSKFQRLALGRAKFDAAKVNVIDSVKLSGEAIGFVMDKINGLKDSITNGMFGDIDLTVKDILEELKPLSGMEDDLGKIRGAMSKEQDLRWMKEMAEQRFVNEVNLRQLTPTINLKVSGTNKSPQEYAKALARELQQMADAGTYNAYGDVG